MKRYIDQFNQLGRRKWILLSGLAGALLVFGVMLYSLSPRGNVDKQVDTLESEHSNNIVTLSPEAVQQIGIQVATVSTNGKAGVITSTGEVRASEDRVFHISPFVEGRIVQDNTFLGDYVRQGQVLAGIQNQDIAKIQAEYIHELHNNEVEIEKAQSRLQLAQKVMAREKRLYDEGISPRSDVEAAENAFEQARIHLEGEKEHQIHIKAEGKALMNAYGLSPGSVHSENIHNTSPVTASRSGVVIEKHITPGDMVTPGTVMYTIADLSQVWLDVTVYPQDFNNIRPGSIVRFTTDSLPEKVFLGKINYIPPQTNKQTQTFIARAYLNNPGGLLKPGMFGTVSVQTPVTTQVLFITQAAVQRNKGETFVFKVVRHGVYRKQPIVTGHKLDNGYLVEQGLQAGDSIVTKGSFHLKAELLKGELADDHGH